MGIVPKLTNRFNVFPIRMPKTFFTELGKVNPKTYVEPKETYNSRSIPGQQEQNQRGHNPDLKLYYKVIKSSMVLAQKQA